MHAAAAIDDYSTFRKRVIFLSLRQLLAGNGALSYSNLLPALRGEAPRKAVKCTWLDTDALIGVKFLLMNFNPIEDKIRPQNIHCVIFSTMRVVIRDLQGQNFCSLCEKAFASKFTQMPLRHYHSSLFVRVVLYKVSLIIL